MRVDIAPEQLLMQLAMLVCTFVLSAVIGFEREMRHKSAGARTHILVGLGAALFTLVSVYGFSGAIEDPAPRDPARIAAQIVTGIGFLGAGVIFVRQNIVSGLTTAASIWVTAAVGMACGAGMPIIAAVAVALYLAAVSSVNRLARRMRQRDHSRILVIQYADGHGILRDILATSSQLGYEAALVHTRRTRDETGPIIEATLRFTPGAEPQSGALIEEFVELPGVRRVQTGEDEND